MFSQEFIGDGLPVNYFQAIDFYILVYAKI